jgi:hypothetical protein
MDGKKKRQELVEQYKNRRPEMGVISFRCKATGESFLGTATDTKAGFNSTGCQLNMNLHPNKRLQALWNQYGADGFDLTVVEALKYDDPLEDHTEALEDLREYHLAGDPNAKKIWR